MFHNFCPHCGKPLPAGALFCPYCQYQLGSDLRQIDASKPLPGEAKSMMGQDENYVEPSLPMQHLGLPVSAWDGKVHSLVSADGQYKWDGHAWVSIAHQLSPDGFWRWDGYNWVASGKVVPPPWPFGGSADLDLRDAVADTAPKIKKGGLARGMSKKGWVMAIVIGVGGAAIFVGFIFSQGSGGITPGGGSAYYYLHYNCNGYAYCRGHDSNGALQANTGIVSTAPDQSSCEAVLGAYKTATQQSGTHPTAWCSTSNNTGDTGP